MEAPDIDNICETFVRLPLQLKLPEYYEILRTEISPLIRSLVSAGTIGWYSFQLHDKHSGVPTTPDDLHRYVHLRLETALGVTIDDLEEKLPASCHWTRQAKNRHSPNWSGRNETLRDLSEFWRVEGEASEWVLRMLDAHKESTLIPPTNADQFIHYIHNQAGLEYEPDLPLFPL